ncbi:hypothetical protein NL676_025342 [Syzygium grande]|nr:hypothetical protein NL676_025342 [Syzygium grande]
MMRTLSGHPEREARRRGPRCKAVRHGWSTRWRPGGEGLADEGAEEDKDGVNPRQVQRKGVAGEVGHELDANAREGRVGGPGWHEEEGGRGGGSGREGMGVAERGVDGGGEGGGVEQKTGGRGQRRAWSTGGGGGEGGWGGWGWGPATLQV